jgi:hypothetical protein
VAEISQTNKGAQTMSDVVVTVPKSFGLKNWIDEGDPAGEPWSGQYWAFYLPSIPKIEPGERVYIVYDGMLRGYSPLIQLKRKRLQRRAACALIRGGDAVAVTIPEKIMGFRGFRYRWWRIETEKPFPDWKV